MNRDLKSFLMVFICVVLFTFLWKFFIVAFIIWYILKKGTKYYFDHKEEWLNEDIYIRSASSKDDVSIRIEIRDTDKDENASLEVTRISRTDLNIEYKFAVFEPAVDVANNILKRRGLKVEGDIYKYIQNAVNIIAFGVSVLGEDCDILVDIPVKLVKSK